MRSRSIHRTGQHRSSMCIVDGVGAMSRIRRDLTKKLGSAIMDIPGADNPSDQPPPTPPKLARYQATLADRTSPRGAPSPPSLSRPNFSSRSGVRRRSTPGRPFMASARGDVDDLRSWLKGGGDPNLTDNDGWAPILHASVSAPHAAPWRSCEEYCWPWKGTLGHELLARRQASGRKRSAIVLVVWHGSRSLNTSLINHDAIGGFVRQE